MPVAMKACGDVPAPFCGGEYFVQAREAFGQACKQAGETRRYFRLGPQTMCLHFAGDGLKKTLPRAMAHIETAQPATSPDLTVLCWDSASTGTALPAPPWPAEACLAKGYIEGFNDRNYHTVCQPGTGVLNLYDAAARTGIYWAASPAAIPYWEYSFPMRGIIHWWTERSALQLVHAGALELPGKGGALLAGKSGSGKSTTTLACLGGALRFVSDDYVLTQPGEPACAYGPYSTAKLVPENVARFPHLAAKVSNPGKLDAEKALIYVHDHFPAQTSGGCPINAILLPRVTGGAATTLHPAGAGQALFALAPTTVLHLEGHSKLTFEKISNLVQGIPCYWLDLGTDLAQIPAVITRFLESGQP